MPPRPAAPDIVCSEPPSRSRRSFVVRLAAVGASAFGLGGLLGACGGEERPTRVDEGVQAAPGEGGGPTAPAEAVTACEDYTGLSEQELQKRVALQYVADSPNPNELCSNCRFWVQPEGDDVCGGCTLFAGPVNPGGWCASWAAQA